jgi:hypothetical protein
MSSIGVPGQQRDEAVPQLSRCPRHGVHPRRGEDAPEGSADVCGIKRGAGGRREQEIELLELASAFGTLLLDQIPHLVSSVVARASGVRMLIERISHVP